MGRVLGAVLVLAMLAGCAGQASNAPERPEKEGAEQTSKEVSTPTPEPSTPAPEVESASADAEKAEAANHEMTLEDLEKMSDENAILLGTCQTAKYQMENGKAAMDRWTEDFVDDVASASSASEVVSVQEAMIKESYSCTFQEMIQVSTSGTLEE
jgi:hypothetical protein